MNRIVYQDTDSVYTVPDPVTADQRLAIQNLFIGRQNLRALQIEHSIFGCNTTAALFNHTRMFFWTMMGVLLADGTIKGQVLRGQRTVGIFNRAN